MRRGRSRRRLYRLLPCPLRRQARCMVGVLHGGLVPRPTRRQCAEALELEPSAIRARVLLSGQQSATTADGNCPARKRRLSCGPPSRCVPVATQTERPSPSRNRSPPPCNRGPPPCNRSPPPCNRSPPPCNRGPPPCNRGPPPCNATAAHRLATAAHRSPPPCNRRPPPCNRGPPPCNRCHASDRTETS